jgi:ketosteroid isomerase-like protein
MPTLTDPIDVIRHYLKAIETGTFAEIEPLFTPDVVVEQLPNRIYPQGLRADRAVMSEAFERGRKVLSSQRYEIKNAVAHDNLVSVEVLWTGTLAVEFGTLAVGSQMRCHSAMFFEFRDGKIASQRNYDCFEPW